MVTKASSEEHELWAKAQKGNADARDSLSRLAAEVARAELIERGAEADSIENLVQQAVASILDYMSRGGEIRRNLRAFLKYRAWGVLSDYRRKRREASKNIALHDAPEPSSPLDSPVMKSISKEAQRAVTQCYRRLKPAFAEVVWLRYHEQHSNTEIAAACGVTANTINLRLFRALREMRRCLESKGFGEDLLG